MTYSQKWTFPKTGSRSGLAGLAAAVCLAVAGLSGCGHGGAAAGTGTLTQANLDKVQRDMSAQDVKALLGEPTETKSEPIPIVGGTKTTYVYTDSHQDRVVIVLKNDNVQTIDGHFAQ